MKKAVENWTNLFLMHKVLCSVVMLQAILSNSVIQKFLETAWPKELIKLMFHLVIIK
jgi:hypothetical protein